MSDAPERIWAVENGKGGDWGSYNGLYHTSGGTEYVRADYIKDIEAKLEMAVKLVEEAYSEGFAEGHVGSWIEGDYSKPWKKSTLFTTLAELRKP